MPGRPTSVEVRGALAPSLETAAGAHRLDHDAAVVSRLGRGRPRTSTDVGKDLA
ncbi:hypothetical protein [Nocardioides plantarum]|uniref:hypothetical protein n=1 Tax=Nocardioides plantarum TaxID=29299 RepID=UPI00360A46BC